MFQQMRIAKHTKSIHQVKDFYCTLLGLKVIGSFQDHLGYDGIFIGNKGEYHMEFTTSNETPKILQDPDDLMVFYCENEEEYYKFEEIFAHHLRVETHNPYWHDKGLTVLDPDGNVVVICKANC
jgi:catechol 2,3-dioxygenase-like lactoylglutathione lyase family enzyme